MINLIKRFLNWIDEFFSNVFDDDEFYFESEDDEDDSDEDD